MGMDSVVDIFIRIDRLQTLKFTTVRSQFIQGVCMISKDNQLD